MTKESDNRRKCWYCEDGILIWSGDHECEPEDDHLFLTTLCCLDCNALYLVYWNTPDATEA